MSDESDDPVEKGAPDYDDIRSESAASESPRHAPAAGRPRIEGVEAAVAAGLVPPPKEERVARGPRHLAAPAAGEDPAEEGVAPIALPDWTDPPTREVPRVLLREGAEPPPIPGPVWRESGHDFEQDEEAFAEMVSGTVPVVEHDIVPGEDDIGLEPAAEPLAPPPVGETPVGATPESRPSYGADRVSFAGRASWKKEASPQPERKKKPPKPTEGPPARRSRSPVVSTATGLVVGGIALVCFWLGPVATLAVAAAALFLASAEYFAAVRRARYQPATLLGLVAAPGFVVAGYERGPLGVAVAMAVAVVAVAVWYLVGVTRRAVTANISVSIFGIGWIAFLGSFAGLLLNPAAFPGRHGVAYLLGAAEVTVAYDVGGYVFGSLFGRHRLAPSLSPGKTWEGLVAGSLSAVVVGLAVTSEMHPWTLAHAAALAVIAAILAPVGDLAESMVKRDLRVKDMGRLLPAHGGLLDRIDALLFVLPATYLLVRLVHG